MTIVLHRLRAALLPYAFGIATILAADPLGAAAAQSGGVEVPTYRQLNAGEPMASPGENGVDHSANPPSLAGMTLLATVDAPSAPRLGYFIQAQCVAGLTVVLDDENGSLAPTVVLLDGPATNGGQGGSLSMAGMPHTGRIRIYSSSAGCQMAARAWRHEDVPHCAAGDRSGVAAAARLGRRNTTPRHAADRLERRSA